MRTINPRCAVVNCFDNCTTFDCTLNDGFQPVTVDVRKGDGSGSLACGVVIIIIIAVEGTPTGSNLPPPLSGVVGSEVKLLLLSCTEGYDK